MPKEFKDPRSENNNLQFPRLSLLFFNQIWDVPERDTTRHVRRRTWHSEIIIIFRGKLVPKDKKTREEPEIRDVLSAEAGRVKSHQWLLIRRFQKHQTSLRPSLIRSQERKIRNQIPSHPLPCWISLKLYSLSLTGLSGRLSLWIVIGGYRDGNWKVWILSGMEAIR